MKIKKRYFGLIGIAILAYVLYSLDLTKVVDIILQLNPAIFLLAVLLETIGIFLKGYKYKLVVEAHGKSIPLLESTKYFLIGFFLGMVTPGRIGDIARAFYANKSIQNIGKSLSTVVIDRAIDLAIVIALGLVAVLFFSIVLGMETIPLGIIALAAAAFCILLFFVLKKNIAKFFLKPVFNALIPEKFKEQARTGYKEFYSAIGKAKESRRELSSAAAIGILIWANTVVVIFLYLSSLGIHVPFFFAFLLMPLLTLVEMLPISFSGLGTREVASIFLLGIYGISATQAVAFSILLFTVGYAMNAFIGFILFTKESTKLDFKEMA